MIKTPEKTIWIGGKHSVKAALDSGKRKIFKIVYLNKKTDFLKNKDIKTIEVIKDKFFFQNIFKVDINHQGIAAEVSKIQSVNYETFTHQKKNIIILDRINDPINIGLIIRNALAFGISGVIIDRKDFNSASQVMIKKSSGAIEFIDICLVSNISNTIQDLKKKNFWVYGLDSENGENIYNEKWSEKNVFIFGSEGQGLRELTKKKCDNLISIPMSKNVDSLNVASCVAATLALFNKQTS